MQAPWPTPKSCRRAPRLLWRLALLLLPLLATRRDLKVGGGCGIAAAASHLPSSARPFQQLSPFEAATVARQCLRHFGANRPDNDTVTSEWAGTVLANSSVPVIAGPLVPKAGSTLLRALFGQADRPTAITAIDAVIKERQDSRLPQTAHAAAAAGLGAKFWIAIARDPLSHFVDAYMQASNGLGPRGECKYERIRTATYVHSGLTRRLSPH
jgi:hypothetical protein